MGSSQSQETSTKRDENGSQKTELEKNDEALKALAVDAGLLFDAWGISKVFGNSTPTYERKKMKAPGRHYFIYRDDFEHDPADYFRKLRHD